LASRSKRRVKPKSFQTNSAEIRDPVHGYIFATELEQKIIDTETFQRLRRIRQLAGCHLVYPGGQHSRFEHVIGAMYLAGKVGDILETREDVSFGKEETCLLRLAALLHDVGHGPFSHMFEEVMAERTQFTHEDMTRNIILKSEIGDILDRFGLPKGELSELSIAKSKRKTRYLNDVIGGGLSVDIMDYILRDSYFTGVEYGEVDVMRIINSFEVAENKLAIRQAALFAFEALMIARYEMFRAVYFHRTVRAAELMLIKSMLLADKELHLTDLSLDKYLAMTDEVTLERIRTMKTGSNPDLKKAKLLADDYFRRRLLKCVFEQTFQRKDKFLNSIFTQKKFRTQLAQDIADGASVEVDDIYVDVPIAPSVPISSTREAFQGVTVVQTKGKTKEAFDWRVEDLPLVSTIAGFMDIMRIYTTENNKFKVETAVGKVLGREGYELKVSM
jgi:uncharacterized protein